MAEQYDFSPRVSPMQGVSLSDLIAARQSPLTTLAQSGPGILQALQARRMQAMQQQRMAMLAQGLGTGGLETGDASFSPEQIMAALQLGQGELASKYSPASIEERKTNVALNKARAEAARAKAENDAAYSKLGYVFIQDGTPPLGGRWIKAPGAGTVHVTKPPVDPRTEAKERAIGEVQGTFGEGGALDEIRAARYRAKSGTGKPAAVSFEVVDKSGKVVKSEDNFPMATFAVAKERAEKAGYKVRTKKK